MIDISEQRLEVLFQKFESTKIMVIGDLMLDRYFWGNVNRISPEAPVPVVELNNETIRPGGAANVVHNVASLGAEPITIGVLGNDLAGTAIMDLVASFGYSTHGIMIDATRKTTEKTRIIAHEQHVVRVDRESTEPISGPLCEQFLDLIKEMIPGVDAVIFEDYNKGMITTPLVHGVTELALQHGKIVTVDPKFTNFFEFSNVTLFKPNKKEVEISLGVRLGDDQAIHSAGMQLLRRLNCENVLITMGEKGMYLFEKNGGITPVPTRARKVHDVSGAGDTVISTFTVAMAAGASPQEAATLANYAAGIVVGEVGVVPIEREKLYAEIKR